VWYVGPTIGLEAGVAVSWDEVLHPQLITCWDVTTEETWVHEPSFDFTELSLY